MDIREEIFKNRRRIEALWTERLRTEYENIAYGHRLKLKPPILELKTMSQRWGQWDPESRTIAISQSLVETHPWSTVIEILKHEMAHQIVTEIFRVDDGHGPDFARACALLGLAGWAASATATIPGPIVDWKQATTSDVEERLLARVEKLLALASSSNEHEALLAMQRVQEIYAKYNLDRLSHRRAPNMVTLTICHQQKKIPHHRSVIASLLNDFFFVRIIYVGQYDSRTLTEYKAIEILGTRENVLMAEYVYYFLANQLESLWKKFRQEKRCAGALRRSYYTGILAGFREKLEANERVKETQNAPGAHALIALGDRELDTFVTFKFPRLVNVKRTRGRFESSTYQAGREAGHRLILRKGIEHRDGNRGRLLRG